MKKTSITICLFLVVYACNAQTKKVLLEEFTGAHCGQCPMGSYMLDSLLGVYPDLIGVSLHTYHPTDSMFFNEIDTIGIAYAPGAPVGATDRVYWGSWPYVAEISSNWSARVQTRLALSPDLTVSVGASWNSLTREISAQIDAFILTNMPTGDYRFNLYIVEDTVVGTGYGYDQSNIYNSQLGNPYYGLGDPIVGYVHRNVVRAILPNAWGQPGIISSTPVAGQSFSTSISYTLPLAYDENRIKLVAFVTEFTNGHMGDEVLNAEGIQLSLVSGTFDADVEGQFIVYPNPSSGIFFLDTDIAGAELTVYSVLGERIFVKMLNEGRSQLDLSSLDNGIYILNISNGERSARRTLVINRP